MGGRQLENFLTKCDGKWVRRQYKSAARFTNKRCYGRFNIQKARNGPIDQVQGKRFSCGLRTLESYPGARIVGVVHESRAVNVRRDLLKQANPLCSNRGLQIGQS